MRVPYDPVEAQAVLHAFNSVIFGCLIVCPEFITYKMDIQWLFSSSSPIYLKVSMGFLVACLALFPLFINTFFWITDHFTKKAKKEVEHKLRRSLTTSFQNKGQNNL